MHFVESESTKRYLNTDSLQKPLESRNQSRISIRVDPNASTCKESTITLNSRTR